MSNKRFFSFVLICAGFTVASYGQNNIPDTLAQRFHSQLTIFPQEKIYLHTDKPYYITGERIWFRAYVADAVTHSPAPFSRYVYVELINPLDSVVVREKIRPDKDDAYHGHLPIPEDVPQGAYTLRAYTLFMQNQDERFFYTKAIHIGDPQAGTIEVSTKFFFESEQHIHATFRFTHAATSTPLVPELVKVGVNDGGLMKVNVTDDGSATVNFRLPATSRERVVLLEVTADKYPYRQFVSIPVPDSDFDVSFYPEGGALMLGAMNKVAFKAMKSNGESTHVSGVVYSHSGAQVGTFASTHLGMGLFSLLPQKGVRYYAVCENEKGRSKRFDLPVALDFGYSLAVREVRENLHISLSKPQASAQQDELYLLAHTRGAVHLIEPWNHERNTIVIHRESLPSGVLHLVLFDSGLNPVSERLFFICNEDQAQVFYDSDQESYAPRSLVRNRVTVTDCEGLPLLGTFSVSVTSDREVTLDSTVNILTHLLLTSDLRGQIETPAFYFQGTPASSRALDLLMLTQGWRRYQIAEMAQGRFSTPTLPLELGPEITGTVKSVLLGRPVEDATVTVTSLTGAGFFGTVQTDKDGRFHLPIAEFPDSTRFIVSVEPNRGMTRMELILDGMPFPKRTLATVPRTELDSKQLAHYANIAEQQYIYEGGTRVTQLAAAVVTAERKAPKTSLYYSRPDRSMTEEMLEKNSKNIGNLLNQFAGIRVAYDETGLLVTFVSIRGGFPRLGGEIAYPLVLVDDIPVDFDYLNMININDIAQIDILNSAANTAAFGIRGSAGVIAIHTKDGSDFRRVSPPSFHIKTIMPLGYQQRVEFYAPKYETEAQRNSYNPDRRTTTHWQPVLQTNNRGEAQFEFYTADETTSYTVIIEGLANDGTIIRKVGKISVMK